MIVHSVDRTIRRSTAFGPGLGLVRYAVHGCCLFAGLMGLAGCVPLAQNASLRSLLTRDGNVSEAGTGESFNAGFDREASAREDFARSATSREDENQLDRPALLDPSAANMSRAAIAHSPLPHNASLPDNAPLPHNALRSENSGTRRSAPASFEINHAGPHQALQHQALQHQALQHEALPHNPSQNVPPQHLLTQQLLAEMVAKTGDSLLEQRLLGNSDSNSQRDTPSQRDTFYQRDTPPEISLAADSPRPRSLPPVALRSNGNAADASLPGNSQALSIQVTDPPAAIATSAPANPGRSPSDIEAEIAAQERLARQALLQLQQLRNRATHTGGTPGLGGNFDPNLNALGLTAPGSMLPNIALSSDAAAAINGGATPPIAASAMAGNSFAALGTGAPATTPALANLLVPSGTTGSTPEPIAASPQTDGPSASSVSPASDSAQSLPAFDLTSNRPLRSPAADANDALSSENENAQAASFAEAAAEPSPGQWKQEIHSAIAAMQRTIENSAGAERQTLEVYLRLLRLIANDHDAAVRTIDSLPPPMQEFWREQLFALAQITRQPDDQQDALFVNNSRRATKALTHFSRAMDSLRSSATLQITNSQFCSAIRSFGDYDAATSTTLAAGDPLLVYCEVENYSVTKLSGPKGERFQARLRPAYSIYNDQKVLVGQMEYPMVEDQCKSQRQDFYLILELNAPSLPSGRYHLQISVEDVEGAKIAVSTPLSFQIR